MTALWFAGAAVFTAVVAVVVGRVAWARGVAAERARMLRSLHDTVLQTLEAMALAPGGDLRTMARREATRVRRLLAGGDGPARLADMLATTVDEATLRGLRVTLIAPDDDDDPLTAARRTALCDATREALANVAKHSGVDEAVVRVDAIDGGVEVTVRDHGCGFVTDPARFGYGLRESLLGRMSDAGGRASVDSEPGRGTRVRLWVPA